MAKKVELGGPHWLPESVSVMTVAAVRCNEIKSLRETLKSRKSTKLAFQRLPRHMRRRIMSHNVKRLPRRLREVHLNQMKKSGMPPQQKRPSRKYRRRPNNLMNDYLRRQRNITWLETHIWHAKRFHMVNKWGYRLPQRPCDKAFRACYRASAKHCLLQDISYISCLELVGEKDILISKLKELSNNDEKLSIGAKIYLNGNREGETTFYSLGENREAIGKVLFNWNICDKKSTLWMWIHAAYYEQVFNLLIELFILSKKDDNTFENGKIVLRKLKFDLNRFRLTGPLVQSVLREALKPVDVTKMKCRWLETYLKNDNWRQTFSEQISFWESIKYVNSPALLAPKMVMSLIVTDPRFAAPPKRTKAVPDKSINYSADVLPPISQGPIWDPEIRTEVKKFKISNAVVNDIRSQQLVPGLEINEPAAPIPLLLIQRPGKEQSGYSSGWDIIIPSKWAQPFWMCLIMWGARVGGLRESESIDFELGKVHFLAPDTKAGMQEEKEDSEKSIKRFFSLPPNKRCNYNKFSIVSPLKCNWKILIEDWSSSSQIDDFRVLRNVNILEELKNGLLTKNRLNLLKSDIFNGNYLVPVKLEVEKSLLVKFAIICIPSKLDIKMKKPPVEPIKEDKLQEERKKLRKAHQSLLKKLKKKRHIAKKEGHKIDIDMEVLMSYQKKMRDLWLPEIKSGIRNSCSRQIMGFVTKGDFSLTSGKSAAVGYISIAALKSLLSQHSGNKVLARNTHSRQYQFATLNIVI